MDFGRTVGSILSGFLWQRYASLHIVYAVFACAALCMIPLLYLCCDEGLCDNYKTYRRRQQLREQQQQQQVEDIQRLYGAPTRTAAAAAAAADVV
jgi:hypothetical protein